MGCSCNYGERRKLKAKISKTIDYENNSDSKQFDSERGNDDKETFKEIEIAGRGSTGFTIVVQSSVKKKLYIVKKVLDKKNFKNIFNESYLLEKCHHPNIENFKQIFKERKNDKVRINLVVEFANEGDLQKKLNENNVYDETTLIFWLMQICLGLSYLHKKKIIHRDIKPHNIFLKKNGIIKIGDLGLSKEFNNEKELDKKNTIAGTINYMSPEMKTGIYDEKTDIYSLGITFLQFILKNNIYSNEFSTLINSLFEIDKNKRPSAEEILKNPVIKNKMKTFLEKNNFENSYANIIMKEIRKSKVVYKDEDSFIKYIKKEWKKLYNENNNNKDDKEKEKIYNNKDLDILMCIIDERIHGKNLKLK